MNDKIEINKLIKESKITKRPLVLIFETLKNRWKKEITFKKGKKKQANLGTPPKHNLISKTCNLRNLGSGFNKKA